MGQFFIKQENILNNKIIIKKNDKDFRHIFKLNQNF